MKYKQALLQVLSVYRFRLRRLSLRRSCFCGWCLHKLFLHRLLLRRWSLRNTPRLCGVRLCRIRFDVPLWFVLICTFGGMHKSGLGRILGYIRGKQLYALASTPRCIVWQGLWSHCFHARRQWQGNRGWLLRNIRLSSGPFRFLPAVLGAFDGSVGRRDSFGSSPSTRFLRFGDLWQILCNSEPPRSTSTCDGPCIRCSLLFVSCSRRLKDSCHRES